MTPLEFPADWPPSVRRYVTHLAMQKLVMLHDGWPGLAEYLFRGHTTTAGEIVRWSASFRTIWPELLAEAEVFDVERKAEKAKVSP